MGDLEKALLKKNGVSLGLGCHQLLHATPFLSPRGRAV